MSDLDPKLLESFRTARHVAILTGAGVSAESGVPTFREALTGLWTKYDPAELATPEAFARDPQLVARWYDQRRCNVAACKPNPGHFALARFQQSLRAQGRTFTLITQNVDRLHQAAGSTDVIELHGTLWIWRCVDCHSESEERGPAFATHPPICPCGGRKRPGVVWFGEPLPPAALLQAQRAAASSNLFLSIGTSSIVHPAAGLMDLAIASGAQLLEINPQQTPYTPRAHWSLRASSGAVLPKILAGL